MIEIRQLKLSISSDIKKLEMLTEKALNLNGIKYGGNRSYSFTILKKSLDARKKPDLYYIYTIGVTFEEPVLEQLILAANLKRKPDKRYDMVISEKVSYSNDFDIDSIKKTVNSKSYERPVVVGFGPAGIFCAYLLALNGFKPIVIERGETVDEREKSVKAYFESGVLNTESNIQFGEGGAGTFSDGKLNTLTKDKYGRQGFVLDTFVRFGAPDNIRYDAKPHIGTDILSVVVKNIREEIIKLGGTFYFNTSLFGLDAEYVNNDRILTGIRARSSVHNNDNGEHLDVMLIGVDHLVLAIGHSARDTFEMLKDSEVGLEPKSFAVGFRVEHPQKMINISQYGENYPDNMEAAAYKVTNTASNGRRVYSFCMCPGGHVVDSSSEEGRICVNGMSYSGRDSEYANSAIIIGVDPKDYYSDEDHDKDDPLIGMYYQRMIEKRAYEAGGGKVPYQFFSDFEKKVNHNTESGDSSDHEDQTLGILGRKQKADLSGILEWDMNEAFVESMHRFGRSIKGFDNGNSVMYGVEARTSSPVRILRDDLFRANIKGLYPCGEGAGYAGGIMSAAVDGIKVAEAVINDYLDKNFQ